MEKADVEKLVLSLLKKIDKCQWSNYHIHQVNHYDLKVGGYKISLWKSISLQSPPAFIQVKNGDTILEESYHSQKVQDLFKIVDKKYGEVEKKKKEERDKVINSIITELNQL